MPVLTTLDALKPGLLLGRYQCLMPIARGGMAAVWAARTKGARGFEKTVALKTMLPVLSDDPSFTQMFLDEARIAARIRHPNVVEVSDLGEEGELLYLVMEWIDGEPLSVVLREAARARGVPLEVSARIVVDACAGLHAAHELCDDDGRLLGLVHRDVSPQNILLSMSGQTKIVDFGIAKLTERASYETAPGQTRGKIAYMSPEQALTKPLDRRSDVFAMGTVLYQLVTGKHPFRGDSDLETLQNIVLRPMPRPSAVASAGPLSAALEEVIVRALERDPRKRFSTAAELAKAVEQAIGAATITSSNSVGSYLEQLLGARAKARRDALRAAIAGVNEGATPTTPAEPPLIGPDVSTGWRISRRHRPLETPGSAGSLGRDPAPPRRPWIALALAGAVLLLVGVGLGVSITDRATPTPEASPASAPEATVSPPAASADSAEPEPAASEAADDRASASDSGRAPKARAAPPRAPPPRVRPTSSASRWAPPVPQPGF